MPRPNQNEHPVYFSKYINLVKGNTIEEAVENHHQEILDFYLNLPNEKALYAYAPDKWTINDVLQHVLDTETVFNYRALIVARKSDAILSSFDENEFATQANASLLTITHLKEEILHRRNATNFFFKSLSTQMLHTTGIASNQIISVNALAFMNLGHYLHHKNILEERYL